MRVAISGSRGPDPSRGRPVGWTDFDIIDRTVARLLAQGHTLNVGDASSGVDAMVREAFDSNPEYEVYPSSHLKVYPARWAEEGKRAGHNRNGWMISESDMLIAFFAPVSPLTRGTTDAVRHALRKGIPVHVYYAPLGGWLTALPEELA